MTVRVWYEWRENGTDAGAPVFSREPLSAIAPFLNVRVAWPSLNSDETEINIVQRMLDGACSASISGRAAVLTDDRFTIAGGAEGERLVVRPPIAITATTSKTVVPGSVAAKFQVLRPVLDLADGIYTGRLVAEIDDSIPIPLKVRAEAPSSGTPEKYTFSSEPIDPMDLLVWLRAQTKPGHSSAAVVTAGQQVVNCSGSIAPAQRQYNGVWLARSEVNGPTDKIPGIGAAFRNVLARGPADPKSDRPNGPRLQTLRQHIRKRVSLAWVHTEEYQWNEDGSAISMFPAADAISALASGLAAGCGAVDLRGGAMLGRFAFLPGTRKTGWFARDQPYTSLTSSALKDWSALSQQAASHRLDAPWLPADASGIGAEQLEQSALRQPSARQVAMSGGLCVIAVKVIAIAADTGLAEGGADPKGSTVELGSAQFFVRDPADVIALAVHAGSSSLLAMQIGAESGSHSWLEVKDWLAALQLDRNAVKADWAMPLLPKVKGKDIDPFDSSVPLEPAIAILGCDAVDSLRWTLKDVLRPAVTYPKRAACMVLGFSGSLNVYLRPRFATRPNGQSGSVAFLAGQGAVAGMAIQAVFANAAVALGRQHADVDAPRDKRLDRILETYSLWASILSVSARQLGLVYSRWGVVDPILDTLEAMPELTAKIAPVPAEPYPPLPAEMRRAAAWNTIESRTTTLASAERLIAPYILVRYQKFMGLWKEKRAFRAREL